MKLLKRNPKTKFVIKIPHGPHCWRYGKYWEYDTLEEAKEALEYYLKQEPHIVKMENGQEEKTN